MSFQNITFHENMREEHRNFGKFMVVLQNIRFVGGETAESLILAAYMKKHQYVASQADIAKTDLYSRIRVADSSGARDVDLALADIKRYAWQGYPVTGEQLYALFNPQQDFTLTEECFDNQYWRWVETSFDLAAQASTQDRQVAKAAQASDKPLDENIASSHFSVGPIMVEEAVEQANHKLPFRAYAHFSILGACTAIGAGMGSSAGGIGAAPGAMIGFVVGLCVSALFEVIRSCFADKKEVTLLATKNLSGSSRFMAKPFSPSSAAEEEERPYSVLAASA